MRLSSSFSLSHTRASATWPIPFLLALPLSRFLAARCFLSAERLPREGMKRERAAASKGYHCRAPRRTEAHSWGFRGFHTRITPCSARERRRDFCREAMGFLAALAGRTWLSWLRKRGSGDVCYRCYRIRFLRIGWVTALSCSGVTCVGFSNNFSFQSTCVAFFM